MRGCRKGFSKETIQDRIKLMIKNVPKGNWWQFDQIKTSFTYIIQCWVYKDKTVVIKHLCSQWMREIITKKLTSDYWKARYMQRQFYWFIHYCLLPWFPRLYYYFLTVSIKNNKIMAIVMGVHGSSIFCGKYCHIWMTVVALIFYCVGLMNSKHRLITPNWFLF